MKSGKSEHIITRREFLRRAAAGGVCAFGVASGLRLTTVDSAADALQGGLGMPYRTLGRAGLKVSVLGLGTSQIDDPAVARRCLDFGINYFDTADCYMGGNSEVALGKALRGHRDKAIIATKWHPHDNRPVRELIASVDTSLRRLGIDHIDLIQVHGATNTSHATGETGWEAFNRLKEAGKVRFNGLSTHENRVEVVRAAIKSGHYDAVLVKHNAMTADTMKPVIREAHEAGIGVVVMKALWPVHSSRGSSAWDRLGGSQYQRALQWVAQDPNVSTVIVNMATFKDLEEDVAAVTSPASREEMELFEQVATQASKGTCHLCGACTAQCPKGVPVADIMRYRVYREGYGARRAFMLYRSIPPSRSALACQSCSECQVVCPRDVPVRAELLRVHEMLH